MAIGGETRRDGDCPQRMSDRAMRPERIRPAALGLPRADPAVGAPRGGGSGWVQSGEPALQPVASRARDGASRSRYNFIVPKWGQRRVVAFMDNLAGPP